LSPVKCLFSCPVKSAEKTGEENEKNMRGRKELDLKEKIR
jgi:hypothetical protein